MDTHDSDTPNDAEHERVDVLEWDGISPLPAGATDAHLLEDAEALPTWDILRDRPPRFDHEKD